MCSIFVIGHNDTFNHTSSKRWWLFGAFVHKEWHDVPVRFFVCLSFIECTRPVCGRGKGYHLSKGQTEKNRFIGKHSFGIYYYFFFTYSGGLCVTPDNDQVNPMTPNHYMREGKYKDAQIRRHPNAPASCVCSGHCAVSNTSTAGKQPLFNLHQANLWGCSIHQGQLLIQSAGGYLHSPRTALVQT